MTNKKLKHDVRHISYFNLMFDRVYCPKCNKKMKRVDWPYTMGWQCSNCKWVTWYK